MDFKTPPRSLSRRRRHRWQVRFLFAPPTLLAVGTRALRSPESVISISPATSEISSGTAHSFTAIARSPVVAVFSPPEVVTPSPPFAVVSVSTLSVAIVAPSIVSISIVMIISSMVLISIVFPVPSAVLRY